MDLANVIGKVTIDVFKKYTPQILTGVSVTAGAGATVLCGINSVKARDIIEEIRCDAKYDNYDKKDLAVLYFKELVPLYGPVLALQIASAAAGIGGMAIQTKKLNAATATGIAALEAAALSREALESYKKHTKDILTEEQQKEVEKRVQEDTKYTDIRYANAAEPQLFLDSATGQRFYSTREHLAESITVFNNKMLSWRMVSINEWIDIVDVDEYIHVCGGDERGWDDRYMPLTISYRPVALPDGRSALEIEYSCPPNESYRHRY